MKLISHRGNLDGAIPELENRPDYLLAASENFSVEVDVWYRDGKFYTGHDLAQYEVDQYFLQNKKFLLHAKDVDSFLALIRLPHLEIFYQEENFISCTTKGRVVFHEKIQNENLDRQNFILVDINGTRAEYGSNYSILTDYPKKLSTLMTPGKAPFDVLVLDIDGVMTNGTKLYTSEGVVTGKRYNDRDFTAIKRFLTEGIEVVFLSGDKTVNEGMAKSRGIEFVYAKSPDGNIDKSKYIDKIRDKYGAKTIAYVGDDFYDLSAMAVADISFCPSDASSDVKSFADHVLTSAGGTGVVAELFDLVFSNEMTKYPHDFIKSKFV